MSKEDLDTYLHYLDNKKITYASRHWDCEAQANYERILQLEYEAITGFYNQLIQ